LTLHLFAALAEKERAMIAARTKAALAQPVGDLGGPTLAKARKLAIASIKAIADHQAANDLSCTQTALFAMCLGSLPDG
jgi:DNA invertase Pin-like site-specific DNA recombinase